MYFRVEIKELCIKTNLRLFSLQLFQLSLTHLGSIKHFQVFLQQNISEKNGNIAQYGAKFKIYLNSFKLRLERLPYVDLTVVGV